MAARKQNSPAWLAVLAVLLLFASLAFYALIHRPFGPELVNSLARVGGEILITLLLVALGGGLGAILLPKSDAKSLARFALRAALGLGLLSIAFLGVDGLLGIHAWMLWLATILGLVLLQKYVRAWLSDLAALPKLWSESGRLGRSIAVLVGVIFFATLAIAIAPPLKVDTLVYHLSLPLRYLDAGKLSYIEANSFWGFPQLPQMLSTWALALGASRGALVGWAMGLLCVLGLLALVAENLGPRPAWVAVASLLAGASLAASLGWSYVDWPSMLMGWGMIYMLNDWAAKQQARSLLLAGVFAGLAFGTKYSAALLIPLGLLYILVQQRASLKQAWSFLLAALTLTSPWLIRNFLATGNPIYPLLLPGGAMDSFRLSFYAEFPVQGNWLDFIFLPLRATFWGHEAGRVGDAPGYEASIGPLLFVLSLFAWLGRSHRTPKARPLLQVSTVIGLGGLLVWAVLGRMSGHLMRTHLYYSIFPAFAVLAAFGFAALDRLKLPSLRVGRVAAAVVFFTLALTTAQIGTSVVSSGAGELLLGQLEEQDFLESNLGLYVLAMEGLRNDLPANARVLMLWETRGYYCLSICDSDENIDRWLHDLSLHGTASNVLEAWQRQGYTHLLYYRRGAEFIAQDSEHFLPLDLAPLEASLAELPLLRDYKGDYGLYSLSQWP